MLRNAGGDRAEVALVCGVDQGAAVLLGVVLLLECDGPLLEADVGDLLFGTGKEAYALCSSGVAGFGDGGPHLGGGVLLVLEEVESVTAKSGPSELMLVREERCIDDGDYLLETNEVALARHLDTLHHALAPYLNLSSGLGGSGLASTKDLQCVLDNDTIVTKH